MCRLGHPILPGAAIGRLVSENDYQYQAPRWCRPRVGAAPMDRHMADPSIFDSIRIPTETLIALDWRPYHFAMQPYHYLLRTAHILSMALFFGGIGLLDLQLMGWLRAVPLKPFAEFVLPCLYLTFAVTAVTGVALFLYDPLFAGSRAYWTPKLIAIALALANAALLNRTKFIAAAGPDGHMPI